MIFCVCHKSIFGLVIRWISPVFLHIVLSAGLILLKWNLSILSIGAMNISVLHSMNKKTPKHKIIIWSLICQLYTCKFDVTYEKVSYKVCDSKPYWHLYYEVYIVFKKRLSDTSLKVRFHMHIYFLNSFF